MENTVRLYSLPLNQTRTFVVAGVMIAGNMILPALCHLIPQGGLMFLPIYFFTLVGAYKYGLSAGLIIGVLSPVLNSLLTGMPPAELLPPIVVKSVLLAVAAAMAAKRSGRVSLTLLIGVVLAYQFAGTLFEWAYTGSLFTALQDFRLAAPGMLLQVFGGYGVLKAGMRYGF